MPHGLACRIARHVTRKPRPRNGTQYRNRINQAAYKYKVPETRVHTALYIAEVRRHTR